MNRGICTFVILCIAASLFTGCEEPSSSSSSAKPASESGSGPPPYRTSQPQQPEQPATRQEAFTVGAGKKGRGYGNDIVTQPFAVRWRAEEKIIETKIIHALNLYKAEHEKPPQSHEEFMKVIIEANEISLPELPDGHEYKYDPKKGQLMVEIPTQAAE